MKSPVNTNRNGSGKGGAAVGDQAPGAAPEIIFPAPEAFSPADEWEPEHTLLPVEGAEPEVTTSAAVRVVPAESTGTVARARPAAKKGVSRKVVLVLLAAVAVAVLTAWLYLRREPEGRAVPAPKNVAGIQQQMAGGLPAGAFQINPDKQQLIGVQFGTVEYADTSKTLRAVGRIAYDERRITRINPKIEGWIEEVFVDFTGKRVKKGQPLISLYSPDLVQTQAEYLLAIRGRDELAASEFGEAAKYSASLVESARRRLQLWDISAEQIAEIERRGSPVRAMTLYAPDDGFVLTRGAFPRQRVTPETELYTLADLSKVWVMADVYEYEAADVREGTPADVTVSTYTGRTFRGRVSYINPQLESSTRTLKVRVEIANADLLLKPDMYADVTFRISKGRALVVPEGAVMDSGTEQTVFVALGDGYFEPRRVTVGGKVGDRFVVLSGLREGERVVTSGNFLLDSESRLKASGGGAHAGHGGGGGSADAGAAEDHSSHGGVAPKGVSPAPAPAVDHSQHQQEAKPAKSEKKAAPEKKATPERKAEDHTGHQH